MSTLTGEKFRGITCNRDGHFPFSCELLCDLIEKVARPGRSPRKTASSNFQSPIDLRFSSAENDNG